MGNYYCSLPLRSCIKSPNHTLFRFWAYVPLKVLLTTHRFAMILLPDTVSIRQFIFPLTQTGKVQSWVCETMAFL